MAKISEERSAQREVARRALEALRTLVKTWPRVSLECTRPEGVTRDILYIHSIVDFLVVTDTTGKNLFMIKEIKGGTFNVAFSQSGNITALYTKTGYIELVFGKKCRIKLSEKAG